MFIDISTERRSSAFREAAEKWGNIITIDFPEVVIDAASNNCEIIASNLKEHLSHLNIKKGDCVCIAGEYGITFDIVDYVHSCLNSVICVYPIFEETYNSEEHSYKFIKFRIY